MQDSDKKKVSRKRKIKIIAIAAAAVFAVSMLLAAALRLPGNNARTHNEADVSAGDVSAPETETASEENAESAEIACVPGYMVCTGGVFRPSDTLTAGEAADAVLRACGLTVTVQEEDEPLNEETLAALLSGTFEEKRISEAMTAVSLHGSESITRAEAAVFFNRLFRLDAAESEAAYYPDVRPGDWGSGDICTAASGSVTWDGENGRPEEGPLIVDRQLYYVDEDGYFAKNVFRGSLYFDASGRYTSGDAELDGYVLAALREATDESMTREDMLRAMYLYVRDTFKYLTRHYYKTGDVGWAMSEALTMYSTGRGNCYNYAAAFWAAARALGYDAKIVSGTYGEDEAPHGWVEIFRDGERYTYDTELEMAVHRDNPVSTQSFYGMSDYDRSAHYYRELTAAGSILPLVTSDTLLLN